MPGDHARLWGGRFSAQPEEHLWRLNASFPFDRRLYEQDIRGSQAYARALERAGVLTRREREEIEQGLAQILQEFREGRFEPKPDDEDIHTAVERRLTELIGPVAGKLHTGRSRNDQVATDLRLYLREELDTLADALSELQAAALRLAERHLEVLMPGYTHLQRAQPVRFSQWVLSYFWAWQRDRERLLELRRRVNVMPLGSGALAGTALPIDRQALARELGFERPSANSMDAVRDRDCVVETLSWAALLAVHLSQLAEDLIIWSTAEFGFVRLPEAYCTGSSLMPHKRNPDALELLRGKAGRIIGALVGVMTVLKGQPSTYNKDLQEDKEPLFDSLDALRLMLPVARGVLDGLEVNAERMRAALDDGMLATDVADYLVAKGLPFREAHFVVGRAVRRAEELGVPLSRLPLHEWQLLSPLVGEDLATVFSFEASVERKLVQGGTSRAAILEQIAEARRLLERSGVPSGSASMPVGNGGDSGDEHNP